MAQNIARITPTQITSFRKDWRSRQNIAPPFSWLNVSQDILLSQRQFIKIVDTNRDRWQPVNYKMALRWKISRPFPE
jgi:hypothetical protein